MVRSELLQKMRNLHPNILSKDMEKIFEIIFLEFTKAFKRDENIEIRGFGTYKVTKRKDIDPLYRVAGGIFFYNQKSQNIKMKRLLKKKIYLLNEHESFGIYSLYDFIKASSLFDIDTSILNKLIKNIH